MKLQSNTFKGSGVVRLNSQAVVNISLFNTSDTPSEVVIKVLDELNTQKCVVYKDELSANQGHSLKLFANNGESISVEADEGVGVNIGVLNENYIAKGILNTEYIPCVGDGVKSEFSFNGLRVNSFKELRINFDGIYDAIFGKDFRLNDDKSGVIFTKVPADKLEFIIYITKQE